MSDIFTKWVEVFPVERSDSRTLASVLVNEVIYRYCVPSVLHSDQVSKFTSEVMREVCALLCVCKHLCIIPRVIDRQKGSKSVEEYQGDWSDYIPKRLMAYRTSFMKQLNKFSPFSLNFGWSPCLPIDVMFGSDEAHTTGTQKVSDYTLYLLKTLKVTYETVRSNVASSKGKQKFNYEKNGVPKEFSVGDRVWLYIPAVKTGWTKK